MSNSKKKVSKVRIYLDIFFFILMVLVLIPQSTGIPFHEWASFAILVPFFLHLIINWNWIATNSSKNLKKETNKSRFDYILNLTLYFLMIVVTISGIVISEAVLPLFGIHFQPDKFWSFIHNISAVILMITLGVHIALHWKWIVTAFKKLKLKKDFHNLVEIKAIFNKNKRQLLILIVVSIVLSLFIYMLEYSIWAESFRVNLKQQVEEKPKNATKSLMLYFSPLLKVTIFITIPVLITGGIQKLKKAFKK